MGPTDPAPTTIPRHSVLLPLLLPHLKKEAKNSFQMTRFTHQHGHPAPTRDTFKVLLFYLVFDGDGVLHPCGLLQRFLVLQFFLSLFHLLLLFPLHGGHAM